MNEGEIKLTDLIDVDTLQSIQDAFCEMTGIASGISDVDGVMITRDTMSTDFCKNYNKKSPIGRTRCEKCDKRGGELALREGRAVTYHCHAGLVDFAAPIIAHGRIIGGITGGQVRTEELDEERLIEVAKEIGVDPKGYLEASRKIRYIEPEELKRATRFLYRMSTIISEMAYDKYALLQANEEIERAARMKSDFLANMSHEIRTPMNAVIGMAELAMREELTPAAKGYINQIISSGRTLLTIINDILDFSKVESGKMTMDEEEYEVMSIINDVTNIINTRIGDKNLELLLDISPTLPYKLIGDCNRIKQVIINLTNNAVKFTTRGKVILKVDCQKKADDDVELLVSVYDTGIGIKKEDLDKLFQAFEQVDSKRNRNIEGTGLGLAISQKLVNLMGGDISVESEYGKGSMFSFWIPQKVADAGPSVVVKDKEKIKAAGLLANNLIYKHISKDMKQLGINYTPIDTEELQRIEDEYFTHFFVEQEMLTESVESFIRSHPDITSVLIVDFRSNFKNNIEHLRVLKKPIYSLNIASIFNGENIDFGYAKKDNFNFIAPDANILIVDDNAINLTVAEGLLKPLEMNIETAGSGKEAVEMVAKKKYDLIFMDHMMPEVDGVETTHIIRRFFRDYENVPIIALTANAVNGTKEMFIKEGMNDFVAKPIEMGCILSKLKNWLPENKIIKISSIKAPQDNVQNNHIDIEGLDTDNAMKLLGSEQLFWTVLKDFYIAIDKKAGLIKKYEELEDWHAYTIEVHALKSAAKQIGAMELSEKAAMLEKAGNETNAGIIHSETDTLLKQYLKYLSILEPYFKQPEKAKGEKVMTSEVRMDLFTELREACGELDMDKVESVLDEMSEYGYDGDEAELFSQLKEAAGEYDFEKCEEIVNKWEG